MIMLAYTHDYLPNTCAGAEWALHELLKSLQQRGHEVAVICPQSYVEQYDGVKICKEDNKDILAQKADVIIGSHGGADVAAAVAEKYGKKCVVFLHNEMLPQLTAKLHEKMSLVYGNSNWVADKIQADGFLYPVINPERVRVKNEGECITLINLAEMKGADVFWKLAERLPQYKFLAVKGAYDPQIIPDVIPYNVTVMECTEDIKQVYAQTKLLLMPSEYESFGRTAIEAAISGIPTIANPTPGLKESLGDAGVFCLRENLDAWERNIVALMDDETAYRHASKLAKERAEELHKLSRKQIDSFVAVLQRK